MPLHTMTDAPVSGARLDSDILAMLEASALDRDHAKAMRLRLASPAELAALGRKPIKTVAIPYFDLDGQPIDFLRYRYLEDPRTTWERKVLQTKPLRYFQPAGTGLKAYLPPLTNWRAIAEDANLPLLITEGEKKAAAATAHGFPCVGLGGVDSFASKKDDTPILPELMEFAWQGRDVVIVYDSDAHTNPNVLAASVRLGRRLYALGALVRIASLPPTITGEKQGVDDFIKAALDNGDLPATALHGVLDAASADMFEREIALYDFNRQFVYLRDLDRVIIREDGVVLKPDAFAKRAYGALKHREWSVKFDKRTGDLLKVATLVPTADTWLVWDQRLTRNTLDFDPLAGELTERNYNLWNGWPLTPTQGSAAQWCNLLDRLFSNAPAIDRKWFEQWCAWPIQHPGAKLKTACILWSRGQGTGKSTILESLRAVYGTLFAAMNDSAIDLQYTDWLVNKLMVGIDDISVQTRDAHTAKWKNLITSPCVSIHKKYVPTFEIPNRVNFIFTSNEPNALRLTDKDRRYFVHEAHEWGTKDERLAFFNDYYAWLQGGGAATLMRYFLDLDTSSFDPDANALVTAAKTDMVDASKGPLEKWVDDLRDAPDAMLRIGGSPLHGDLWTADDLTALYNDRHGVKTPVTRVTMGMALGAAGIAAAYGGNQLRLATGVRQRLYILRNHDVWMDAPGNACRDHYAATRCR